MQIASGTFLFRYSVILVAVHPLDQRRQFGLGLLGRQAVELLGLSRGADDGLVVKRLRVAGVSRVSGTER